MAINKKLFLTVAFCGIFPTMSNACSAMEALAPIVSEERQTIPCSTWLNTGVFTEAEQAENLRTNLAEKDTLSGLCSKLMGEKSGYTGVSDMAYLAMFKSRVYILLVRACGDNPKKFDGTTWSLPGGRNDEDLPAKAAPREGEEETALTFGTPTTEAEWQTLLANMLMLHHDNPHPKRAGTPMSFGIVPVKSELNWGALSENLRLAGQGYPVDMTTTGRPQAHNEKNAGCFADLLQLIGACSSGKPADHTNVTIDSYDPLTREIKEVKLLMRNSGVYPYLEFKDVRDALSTMIGRMTTAQAKL